MNRIQTSNKLRKALEKVEEAFCAYKEAVKQSAEIERRKVVEGKLQLRHERKVLATEMGERFKKQIGLHFALRALSDDGIKSAEIALALRKMIGEKCDAAMKSLLDEIAREEYGKEKSTS